MASITTTDAVRLDYTETGPVTGRPIVLLAGFRAAAATWLFQVDELADAGYRVIAVDIRGHGTADHPDFGHSMQRRGADVSDVLEALDLHDVVLVGQSMGGNTVWAYLDEFGAKRVSGVVIIDQTPKMLNTTDWPHGFYGYDESNVETYFTEGIPKTGRGTPLWRRGGRLRRLLTAVRSAPAEPRQLSIGELELLSDHVHRDWRAVIAKTTVPVLFLAGEFSEVWPSSHAAASAALTTSGSSAVIRKAGHATNIEQPAEFNRRLREFIATLR
ncbi:MAG TPA: alpha/beta hydrolase [Galbitalea sp.]|jgi:pimeloyl-ACP methyl ester carboxylesterase